VSFCPDECLPAVGKNLIAPWKPANPDAYVLADEAEEAADARIAAVLDAEAA
jgi:hypothetical protein